MDEGVLFFLNLESWIVLSLMVNLKSFLWRAIHALAVFGGLVSMRKSVGGGVGRERNRNERMIIEKLSSLSYNLGFD